MRGSVGEEEERMEREGRRIIGMTEDKKKLENKRNKRRNE